jgi:asparagine synthetase B (glutamine-hydrolysing)
VCAAQTIRNRIAATRNGDATFAELTHTEYTGSSECRTMARSAMGGTNGFVRLEADSPSADREELERTRDAMAARDPDGSGLWISPRGDGGPAHRRLATIDLSKAGAQPLLSADGRYTSARTGRTHNRRENRADLDVEGFRFRSRSDAEVVPALFRTEGGGLWSPPLLRRLELLSSPGREALL